MISIAGGTIGILSPVLMYFITQVRSSDKALAAKDIQRVSELQAIIKEDIKTNKEAIEDLKKGQYQLLDRVRQYQASGKGFYVLRDDWKEAMKRIDNEIDLLKSK